MRSNPPIKGHELLNEGRSFPAYDGEGEFVGWEFGCRCGALPDGALSAGAVKRWHRGHKAALRGD